MTETVTVTMTSDFLPRGEIDRLVRRATGTLPEVADDPVGILIEPGEAGAERGIDPAIVTTLITSGAALLAPFLAKLAELLFRSEPAAKMTVATPTGDAVVIVASLPQESRDALLSRAIESGAVSVSFAVTSPPR